MGHGLTVGPRRGRGASPGTRIAGWAQEPAPSRQGPLLERAQAGTDRGGASPPRSATAASSSSGILLHNSARAPHSPKRQEFPMPLAADHPFLEVLRPLPLFSLLVPWSSFLLATIGDVFSRHAIRG